MDCLSSMPLTSSNDLSLPIAQRRQPRNNAGKPPIRYGYENNHDIANFFSYSNIPPAYKAFVTSLDIMSIPKDWKVAQ